MKFIEVFQAALNGDQIKQDDNCILYKLGEDGRFVDQNGNYSNIWLSEMQKDTWHIVENSNGKSK